MEYPEGLKYLMSLHMVQHTQHAQHNIYEAVEIIKELVQALEHYKDFTIKCENYGGMMGESKTLLNSWECNFAEVALKLYGEWK